MKKDKVTPISSAKPVETAPALKPLDAHESIMLQHLVRKQEYAKAQAQLIVDQASKEVSDFVISVLKDRGLSHTEYGIALADYKTINKLEKPAVPAPAPVPQAAPAPAQP